MVPEVSAESHRICVPIAVACPYRTNCFPSFLVLPGWYYCFLVLLAQFVNDEVITLLHINSVGPFILIALVILLQFLR